MSGLQVNKRRTKEGSETWRIRNEYRFIAKGIAEIIFIVLSGGGEKKYIGKGKKHT